MSQGFSDKTNDNIDNNNILNSNIKFKFLNKKYFTDYKKKVKILPKNKRNC